ncbi:MAG: glycosyltransferase [bacterium]|nr:glycosyltransferase [bacterium]
MQPEQLDKYLYIRETPTWWVRIFYAFGILTWLPIVFTTLAAIGTDPFLTWFVAPIIGILTFHYLGSFVLVLFYRQFDLKKHKKLLSHYWKTHTEPSVDVYLPICGEDAEVLRNTWDYVSRLSYENKKIYVLDDSKEECKEHQQLAKEFGFNYIERPNKGEMKKAGNLKYAYERTNGELIAILDADFAPHTDYLHQLLPYMSETKVGIVQSPQYFPVTSETHASGPLSYGGARAQEVFYRVIQVARDRLGGAHCCGTCAIYRRAALASIGGFVQMGHSEDAHTGFTLTAKGWTIRYVPVLASVGVSPDNAYAFFHQQHRWCLGNILMMLDKKFWHASIPWQVKYCYITGFLFYLHQPFMLLLSFQLFWILLFYNEYISFAMGLPFYPHIIWAFAYLFGFYLAPFRWGYLYAILMRTYSYCHAVITVILGQSVGWIPTNGKHAGVSAAFRQTVVAVGIYTLANLALLALSIRLGALHLLDLDYFTVQFWIFYNTILSCVLLWQLYRTLELARVHQTSSVAVDSSLHFWRLKTAGGYSTLAIGVFFVLFAFPMPLSVNPQPILAQQTTYFTSNYHLNDEGSEILVLQKSLNAKGFILAEEGPGSPGNETIYFGPRTYRALKKFQETNGLPASGYFGPRTRALLNAENDLAIDTVPHTQQP